MSKRDWDVSILHYLGLDHIGHLSGPKSPLIPPKLKEMGDIIEQIASKVFKRPWKEDLPPVLLVLGDHGMADAGGHGGASLPETTTPVVALFSSQFPRNELGQRHFPYLIKQHDLASTLALLTGVPIPRNNIGKFNSDLLRLFMPKVEFEPQEEAFCLYNLEQISSCMKSQFGSWHETTQGFKRYTKIKEAKLGKKFETLQNLMTKDCDMAIHEMSGVLEENMSSFNIKMMLLGIAIVLINFIFFASWHLYMLKCKVTSVISLEGLVIVLNIFRLLSFGSTSFIEEEHQSVYFFVTSICIIIAIKSFQNLSKENTLAKCLKAICNILGAMFLLRIARTINQTGDKWLHLPDVSDYFQKPENQAYLTTIHGLAILLLLTTRLKTISRLEQENKSSFVMTILILIMGHVTVFLQKLPEEMHPNSFKIFGESVEERKLLFAQIVYVLTFLYFAIRIKRAKVFPNCCQIVMDSILLIFSLLVQPYSACLIPLALIIEELVFNSIKKVNTFAECGATYYLFGLATYFHMGNSNSIATVDVGAGYTGVPSFNPVIICLLMAVNTFNGPIIWLLSLFCRLNPTMDDSNEKLEKVLKSLGFYRGCELIFITIICTLCRYHIMVWTVFAPKILYEMMFSLIIALFLTLIFVIKICFVKKEVINKNK